MSYQLSFPMKCSYSFSMSGPQKKDGYCIPLSYTQAIIKAYTILKDITLYKILSPSHSHRKNDTIVWHVDKEWADFLLAD